VNETDESPKRCGTCKYFSKLMDECRKNPPKPIAAPTPNGLEVLGIFPSTTPSGWCGQHEVSLNG
jgi:hypothetical protein